MVGEYAWTRRERLTFKTTAMAAEHRFYGSFDVPTVTAAQLGYGTRNMYLPAPEVDDTLRQCRARLASGGLCPRMAHTRCPHHGAMAITMIRLSRNRHCRACC